MGKGHTSFGKSKQDLLLGCQQCILQQPYNGHWTNTSGHWCYVTALRCYIIKINIPFQPESAFTGAVRDAGDPYINNYGAFLYHIAFEETWFTQRSNNDIGR